ncbi:class I SAM-dependent methyltransferase [Candidatus Poribacteria bacterium]|nr:class I SAM-dependent methyltransferase [Candidatus Poribacteria bacterium]
MESFTLEHCRICRSNRLQHKFDVRENPIVFCAECGFVQLGRHANEAQIRREYSRAYFKDAKYLLDAAARREQKRRLSFMKECGVSSGATVLDVGCATGDFVLMAKETYSVWGTDISEDALQIARDRNPEIAERFVCMSGRNSGVPNQHFDAITMWDVVEHLDDPVALLTQMAGKLKRGGMLFLSSPNIGTFIGRVMGKRWAFMTPPEHIGYFSRETMRKLLGVCGLRDLKWKTKGKWISAGFLVYKAGRVFPEMIPPRFVASTLKVGIGRFPLYIPTGDIQYAAAVIQ